MRQAAVRYVIYSQIVLVITIVICSILDPATIIYRGAISTFGVLPDTMPFFVVGFCAVGGLLWRAAHLLPSDKPSRKLALTLRIMGVALVGLTLTPYTYNAATYTLHGVFAIGLYCLEVVSGAWMLRRTNYDRLNVLLYVWIIAGIIIAALSTSELDIIRLLIVGQLSAIFGYASLLVRSAAQIEHTPEAFDPRHLTER